MNRKKRESIICDAAVRVFASQGYDKTSVSEIIREASVARGTFYLYFKSKKDLLLALVDRFMGDINRDLAKIQAPPDGQPGELQNAYRRLASDLVGTITTNRLLAKLILLNPAGLDADVMAKLNHFFEQTSTLIRQRLDNGIRKGHFRPSHAEVVAKCIFGSIKEIVSHWITHDTFELEPSIRGLIDYLLHGLTVPPATSEREAQTAVPAPAARQSVTDLH